MRVIHIAYSDSDGAGIGTVRLHTELLKQGIDSKMLVAEKSSNHPGVLDSSDCLLPPHRVYNSKLMTKCVNYLRYKGFCLSQKEKYDRLTWSVPSDRRVCFTSPLSQYDLLNHPAVLAADIIHLHWIADFVDYPTFFPNIHKPIVWTFRDENIGFGGFHYKRDYDSHYQYYATLEDAYLVIKRNAVNQCNNIHVVALSKMMYEFCKSSSILSARNASIIHNGIDSERFHIVNKNTGRGIFNIPTDNIVVVFCSVYLYDTRKGLSVLINALESIEERKFTILCIGSGHVDSSTKVDIREFGSLNNNELMSLIYSCGDLFAFPSYQEAFAKTPLEALACGTPIVAFPCSGMEELINDDNGIVCDDFTVESLATAIRSVMNKTYDAQKIRDDVISRFNMSKIASQYIDLYNSLL